MISLSSPYEGSCHSLTVLWNYYSISELGRVFPPSALDSVAWDDSSRYSCLPRSACTPASVKGKLKGCDYMPITRSKPMSACLFLGFSFPDSSFLKVWLPIYIWANIAILTQLNDLWLQKFLGSFRCLWHRWSYDIVSVFLKRWRYICTCSWSQDLARILHSIKINYLYMPLGVLLKTVL